MKKFGLFVFVLTAILAVSAFAEPVIVDLDTNGQNVVLKGQGFVSPGMPLPTETDQEVKTQDIAPLVILGDAPVLGDCTKRTTPDISAWNGEEITVEINPGDHTAGSLMYFFVQDGRDQSKSAGFAYEIPDGDEGPPGQTGQPIGPGAPGKPSLF